MENQVIETRDIIGVSVYVLKYTSINNHQIINGVLGVYASHSRALRMMDCCVNGITEEQFTICNRSTNECVLLRSDGEERRIFITPEKIM